MSTAFTAVPGDLRGRNVPWPMWLNPQWAAQNFGEQPKTQQAQQAPPTPFSTPYYWSNDSKGLTGSFYNAVNPIAEPAGRMLGQGLGSVLPDNLPYSNMLALNDFLQSGWGTGLGALAGLASPVLGLGFLAARSVFNPEGYIGRHIYPEHMTNPPFNPLPANTLAGARNNVGLQAAINNLNKPGLFGPTLQNLDDARQNTGLQSAIDNLLNTRTDIFGGADGGGGWGGFDDTSKKDDFGGKNTAGGGWGGGLY